MPHQAPWPEEKNEGKRKQQHKTTNEGKFGRVPAKARNCLRARFLLSHWPRGSLRGNVLPCTSLSARVGWRALIRFRRRCRKEAKNGE